MEQTKNNRNSYHTRIYNQSLAYYASEFKVILWTFVFIMVISFNLVECSLFAQENSVKNQIQEQKEQKEQKYRLLSQISTQKNINKNAKSSLPDLDSGAYFLENDQSNKRYHCFRINLAFKPPASGYEVAISLRDIENYQPINGLDFAIRYSKQATAVLGVFQIQKQAKWTKVHFWYVFTSRIDLRAGSFIAQTSQFLPCSVSNKQVQVSHHLTNHWKGIKSKDYVVLVAFLAGVKTQDSKLGVYITEERFDIQQNIITLKIQTSNSDSPLESLYICYFIFELGYQYQLSNLLNTYISPQQTDGQNVFVGIRGISTEQQIGLLKSTAILGDPLKLFPKKIGEFRNMFDVKGLVIKNEFLFPIMSPRDTQRDFSSVSSNVTGQNSVSFDDQNRRIIAQYVTIRQCKQRGGFIKTTVKDNGDFTDQCKICGTNSFFNAAKKDCQCVAGFLINAFGICTLKFCPQGQVSINGSCQKKQSLKNQTKQIQNCQQNQEYLKGVCSCKQQFYQINKQCIKKQQCINSNGLNFNQSADKCECIKSKQFYNKMQKKCNRCMEFKEWDQQKQQCKCINGTYQIFNSQQCIKCHMHAYFNGKGCFCFPGYIGDGLTCKKLKSTTILLSSAGVQLQMSQD